jgi:RNA polymerase sigma factor (sigma-70 family)
MPVNRRQQLNDAQLDALITSARRGDDLAWRRLISRFDRLLRSIARSYRLSPADVDDVVQGTWVLLYQHIDRVRESSTISAWLATTTRREAMRVLQKHVREHLCDDPELGATDVHDAPDAVVLAAETRAVLGRAISTLPSRQRQLMTLLTTQPDSDYQLISSTLRMPVGSIGPTRARALVGLSRDPELRNHYVEAAFA